jgi:glycosyltransferase involved in cell wall biosynthesis
VILAVTSTTWGGVTRHVTDLAGLLGSDGYHVSVSGPAGATRLRDWASSNFVPFRPLERLGDAPSRRRDESVFHLHLGDTYDRVAIRLIAAARARGQRVVLTEHLPRSNASDPRLSPEDARRPGAHLIKSVLKRAQYRLCDAVVAVSSGSRDFLVQRYGLRPEAIRMIHNGIPEEVDRVATDWADQTAGPLRTSRTEAPVVVAVGALIQQKGHDTLVRAAGLSSGRWDVRIIGDGPHRTSLERLAREVGRGRVTITGWSDRVGEELATASVFCMPSRWESFPYSCLEAMRMGLPVVATTVDGLVEMVVDGVHGRLVPPDTPAALSVALDEVVADATGLERLSAGARRRASDFSVRRMVAEIKQVYGEVVA